MTWSLLIGVVAVLGVSLLLALARRAELARMKRTVDDRDEAVEHGVAKAQLQHPVIDLSRCLGCGTCVAVCPEEGVLELVHGQAMVVNGARCVGVSACERECPVDAITVTLTDVQERDDIPAVRADLEAVGAPGLFLAGEVTAHALIKTAVEHGTAVGAEVARRVGRSTADNGLLDLCVVGAGPAGLACSLEAKRQGLHFLTLEQEERVGGTVAKYPRRKLVMTQPVDLPLWGKLRNATYTKEELIDLWQGIAQEHELPVATGEVFEGLEQYEDGTFRVSTATGSYDARNVCLALGRRGIPRRLEVPGEDLPKVAYSLIDAHSYQGRKVLVVGGGDSAVEAAIVLAEQEGTEVTLSYRKERFFRVRTENEKKLKKAVSDGKLQLCLRSHVQVIHSDSVELTVERGDQLVSWRLPNDDVFVMVGGVPPFELLQRSGVSFDPSHRELSAKVFEQGTGLARALAVGFVFSLIALVWAIWHSDYYLLPEEVRPTHPKHVLLRPTLGVGLWLGVAAVGLIIVNLLYLLRRAQRLGFRFGSLKLWMTSHVATGVLALLCALVHSAFVPGDSPGAHALWGLVALLVSGAIGRYFYAYVPRAANGRELELTETKAKLGQMSAEWDAGQRKFRERVRAEVTELIDRRQWKSSFFGRVVALISGQRDLRRVLRRITAEAEEQGVTREEVRETVALARRAYRTALMVAHYEDVRAVLNSWRWVHRWVAALMVALLVVHIVHALVYGSLVFGGGVR